MQTAHKGFLLLVLVCGALVFFAPPVRAQTSACGQERGLGTQPLDEAVWKRLNSAYEDVGNELYDQAYKKLQNIMNRARDKYLKAVLYQALAQVEWSRSNYDAALADFEQAVGLNILPD